MCIAYTVSRIRDLLSQGYEISCYVETSHGKAAVMVREVE